MIPNWLILSGIAFGHGCLAIWVINVVHGYGMSERWMKRVAWGTVGSLALLSLAVVVASVLWPYTQWPIPIRSYGVICLLMGLIAFPLATVIRSFRKLPSGIKAGKSLNLMVNGASPAHGSGPRAWWLKIPGNESLSLRASDWQVEIAGLPDSLDGLSILHLSDLHFSSAYDRGYFERVADEAARIEADLVLFTGDLIDSHDAIEWITPIFSRIRGRLGQYAILGNHDFAQDYRSIYKSVRRAGFAILEGRWTRIDLDGSTLALGGTSAPWGRPIDAHSIPAADVRILMSHTPDRLYEAARLGIDLVLSGHNHGGQVRLPIIGPILMPSRYSRRFDLGFFRERETLLHVSAGVGAKHPLRIHCPPEISRLVLRSAGRIGCREPLFEDRAEKVGVR